MTIIYIFERYPVLAQTFLRREVAALRDQGVHVEIFSLHRAGAHERAHVSDDPPVDYFRWTEVVKLVVALPRELLRDRALLRDGWQLFRRYRTNNAENFWTTVWAVIFAICRAKQIRQHKPGVIHGVWATGPATAAAILSRLCGIPFSFGAHAYDIYRHGGDAFLEPKLRAASFVHTTTETAAAYLRERAIPSSPPLEGPRVGSVIPNSPPPEGPGVGSSKIILARRGLDRLPSMHQRDITARPIRLLSIGRLVSKKGHLHQLAACALLKSQGVPFVAKIVGDGPLRSELQRLVNRKGLNDLVILTGALPPGQVEQEYRQADIFWHTGVVDKDGDRDGLPNVIGEAFSYGLPVISSRTPGPMEAVTHETNGLIVDVSDPTQLAGAVKRLADDPKLRRHLGETGRHWVEENFLISRNAAILVRAFHAATVTPH